MKKLEEIEVNSERWFNLEPLENEIWKDIEGYEGIYKISNYGRIITIGKPNNKQGYIYERVIVLKNQINQKTNYKCWRIGLTKNKHKTTYLVHRLVAKTFIPNPNKYKEVNHKNENPLDNRVENLEWCDRLYNANYGYGMKTRNVKRSKPIIQYYANGKLRKIYINSSEIKNTTNYKLSNIINCCNGKQNYKTAYNSKWEYIKNVEDIIKKYEDIIDKLEKENKELKEKIKYE